MWMLGPGIDLALRNLPSRQPFAPQHAFDRQPDDLLRAAGLDLLEAPRPQPARVARVTVVALVFALVPRHMHLLRIDHHDEIAGVDVRRVLGLALAPERVRDLRSEE